jgi:hypothetical protein
MSDRGILMFVKNNEEIDYASIAAVSARYANKHLNVPVSIVTDFNTAESIKDLSVFDRLIVLDHDTNQTKRFYNGVDSYKNLTFKNLSRMLCYDLSPYDQTLVMDIDLFILNDKLKNIWVSQEDFLINSYHVNLIEDLKEFSKVTDTGIDFYWATIFYFKKTEWTKTLFGLCNHIIENYEYYSLIYNLPGNYVRNDYVISIAIHMIYGFENYTKPNKLPCDIYYTLDRDSLYKIDSDTELTFLLQNRNCLDRYLLAKISDQNIHIMNKYNLIENLSRLEEVVSE